MNIKFPSPHGDKFQPVPDKLEYKEKPVSVPSRG